MAERSQSPQLSTESCEFLLVRKNDKNFFGLEQQGINSDFESQPEKRFWE